MPSHHHAQVVPLQDHKENRMSTKHFLLIKRRACHIPSTPIKAVAVDLLSAWPTFSICVHWGQVLFLINGIIFIIISVVLKRIVLRLASCLSLTFCCLGACHGYEGGDSFQGPVTSDPNV